MWEASAEKGIGTGCAAGRQWATRSDLWTRTVRRVASRVRSCVRAAPAAVDDGREPGAERPGARGGGHEQRRLSSVDGRRCFDSGHADPACALGGADVREAARDVDGMVVVAYAQGLAQEQDQQRRSPSEMGDEELAALVVWPIAWLGVASAEEANELADASSWPSGWTSATTTVETDDPSDVSSLSSLSVTSEERPAIRRLEMDEWPEALRARHVGPLSVVLSRGFNPAEGVLAL